MTIQFTCTQCNSVLKIKDELAGTKGRCPKCKTEFAVPTVETVPVVETVPIVESEAIPGTAELGNHQSDEPGGGEPKSGDEPAVPVQQSTEDEDSDSPPLLVMASDDDRESPPALVMKTAAEPETPLRPVAKQAAKTSWPESVAPEPFDPAEFLNAESPKAGRAPHPSAPLKVSADETERGDGDLPYGRGQKSSRPNADSKATAPKSSEAGPLDHVTLAKQMMRAMKDSNTQAAAQREDEKHPAFDYAGLFREIGLKGGGGLAVILLATLALYTLSNRIMGGSVVLPKLGYVSGIVSLDGAPLEGVNVYFSPQEVKIPGAKQDRARTSIGVTDSKGHYTMQYMGGVEGVAVGKCRVWIKLSAPSPGPSIPGEYGEGSMLVKDVVAGSQVIAFEMQSKSKP